MNTPGIAAFAQGREEIWLWPSAVTAYYLTLHDSLLAAVPFLISIPAGAIFYTLYAELRDIVDEQKQMSRTKTRHSRSNKTEPSEIIINAWTDAVDILLPFHPLAQIIVTFGMIIELLLFFLAFVWLFIRAVSSYTPAVTEIGLISLPVLSAAIIIAKILWNS